MKRLFCRCMPAAAVLILCGCGSISSEPEPVLTTESAPPLITTALESDSESTVTTLFQGGIGGEKNANNPQPEHFVYRFLPENISVRLAGGTYQVLNYDFSAIFSAERSFIPFYLDDYDGDGSYDLYAPAAFDGDAVTEYAVYIWKPDTLKFNDTPIIYDVSQTEG